MKDIKTKLKNEDVSTSFLWLQNAGLSIPVYNVDEPYVFCNSNVRDKDSITYLPIYMAGLL